NLRQAEQLPHKLQDKIAEFQAQLANADDAEKEELEKELVSLRSSESERLEAVSDRIAKSVAEFGRLQAQLQKQLAAAPALLPPIPSAPPPAAAKLPETSAKPVVESRPPVSTAAAAETESTAAATAAPQKSPRPRREESSAVVASGVSSAVAPLSA